MLATFTRVRSLVILIALVGVAAWGIVRQLPESEAGATICTKPQEVQSVAFDSVGERRDLPTAALRSVLATHVGDQLDGAKLDHDRAALEAALAARGYLAATVAPPQITFDGGGAFVTFAIAAGPEFRVRAVAVTGVSERDTGVVTLAVGDIVMTDRLERAREALADRLAARGKPTAVTVKLVRDERAATVDVELVAR